MKRIKTERHVGTDRKWKRVIDESDYRKMKRVFNAAMNWYETNALFDAGLLGA